MGTHLRVLSLSTEYQHDRVKMVFKNLWIIVLWTKVTSALEGLSMSRLRAGLERQVVSIDRGDQI